MKIEITKEEAGLIVQLCSGGIKAVGLEQGRGAVERLMNLAEKVEAAYEKSATEKSPEAPEKKS